MRQNEGLNLNHSSENEGGTRVKVNVSRKTVGITLPLDLIERTRKRNLNLSRISEQALSSVLDYLETPNTQTSSDFLSTGSFQKESVVVPRAGFEPATTRSSASPSLRMAMSRALSQAELPRHFLEHPRILPSFVFPQEY